MSHGDRTASDPHTTGYEVVPGSGSGEPTGITGILHLAIDEHDTHHSENRPSPRERQGAHGPGYHGVRQGWCFLSRLAHPVGTWVPP